MDPVPQSSFENPHIGIIHRMAFQSPIRIEDSKEKLRCALCLFQLSHIKAMHCHTWLRIYYLVLILQPTLSRLRESCSALFEIQTDQLLKRKKTLGTMQLPNTASQFEYTLPFPRPTSGYAARCFRIQSSLEPI